MKYTAKGEQNKHFELFNEEGTSVGRLDYNGWFSFEVAITYKDVEYKIVPGNFWRTRIHLVQGDNVVTEISLNWVGQMIVEPADGRSYMFKHSILNNTMTLYNSDDTPLIVLDPDFQWAKFSFNYNIETNDNYPEANDELLMLTLIYCSNSRRKGLGGMA